MNSVQKTLERDNKELNKQTSKNLDIERITQTDRKNWKLEEKIYHKLEKKNLPKDSHRNFEISHEKIIKHSFHNPKYYRKLKFRNHFEIN